MFKLIKDNVPELIKKDGGICNYATAENVEFYDSLLKSTLIEAVNGYLNTNNVEMLAEIMIVISSLIDVTGTSKEEYQKIYQDKMEVEGGYSKHYIGFFQDPQPTQNTTEDTKQD